MAFSQRTQLCLLLFGAILVNHVSAAIRYSYDFAALQLLNDTQRADCETITAHTEPAGRCGALAVCIMTNLDPFTASALGSGTQLLSLIPPALALIPSRGGGVKELYNKMGFVFVLMAIFCGYAGVGDSSTKLSNETAKYSSVAVTDEGENKNDTAFNGKPVMRVHVQANGEKTPTKFLLPTYLRWILYFFTVTSIGVVFYLNVELGLQTNVAWACNHKLLHFGWLLCRMAPGIVELVFVSWLRRKLQADATQDKTTEGSQVWLLSRISYGSTLAFFGLVVIYGTSLFGSTNLIDGRVVIWKYMILLPVLFFFMQSLLDLCVLEQRGEPRPEVAGHCTQLASDSNE